MSQSQAPSTTEQPNHRLTSLLIAWFSRSARLLPWRNTNDPYKVLVSEFMLQQTQVVTVIPYFQKWMQQFPSFESLATADEQDVLRAWEGLGYYSRARNLHHAAKEVLHQYQGKLPPDAPSIRALPGVGPYTAGAIASFAFDLPEPAIDANVQRVLARLFDVRDEISTVAAKSKLETHARALLASAAPKHGTINAAIMELGALICTANKPSCHRCPVSTNCPNRDCAESLPVKRPKPKSTPVNEFALWDLNPEGILLELRNGPRWRGLWTLPNITKPSTATPPLLVQRFTVTRYQISLHILPSGLRTAQRREKNGPGIQRIPLSQVKNLPLAAPHRRAFETMFEQLELPLQQ